MFFWCYSINYLPDVNKQPRWWLELDNLCWLIFVSLKTGIWQSERQSQATAQFFRLWYKKKNVFWLLCVFIQVFLKSLHRPIAFCIPPILRESVIEKKSVPWSIWRWYARNGVPHVEKVENFPNATLKKACLPVAAVLEIVEIATCPNK